MFKVTTDFSELTRWAEKLAAEQVPFATAVALTETAKLVRQAEVEEMRRVFDRPTRFTLNSLYLRGATKRNLQAEVWLKDTGDAASAQYLRPQIYAGSRGQKRFELLLQANGVMPRGWRAVPGKGARMDSAGNMSPAQLVQVLSVLRSHRDHNQNTTDRSRQRAKAAGKQRDYFVSGPNVAAKAGNGGRLPYGVYLRAGGRISTILFFVPAVSYKARFRYFEVAENVIKRELPRQFDIAMRKAMATAF